MRVLFGVTAVAVSWLGMCEAIVTIAVSIERLMLPQLLPLMALIDVGGLRRAVVGARSGSPFSIMNVRVLMAPRIRVVVIAPSSR